MVCQFIPMLKFGPGNATQHDRPALPPEAVTGSASGRRAQACGILNGEVAPASTSCAVPVM